MGNEKRKTEHEMTKEEKYLHENQKSHEEMKEYSKKSSRIKQQLLKEAIEDKQMVTILNSFRNIASAIDRLPTLSMTYQEEKEKHIILMEEYHQTSKILKEKLHYSKKIQANLREKLNNSYEVLIEKK